MDEAALREEIIRLGPWHFEIKVAEGLTTRVSLEAPPGTYDESFGPVSFQDIRGEHRVHLKNLYPDGMNGRTVLDCACNSGGYLFWSRELGAGVLLRLRRARALDPPGPIHPGAPSGRRGHAVRGDGSI